MTTRPRAGTLPAEDASWWFAAIRPVFLIMPLGALVNSPAGAGPRRVRRRAASVPGVAGGVRSTVGRLRTPDLAERVEAARTAPAGSGTEADVDGGPEIVACSPGPCARR